MVYSLTPPPKTAVIDKTADFVARNGPAFEHKILMNEKTNPMFSFLTPTDALHNYYKQRIQELKGILSGSLPEVSAQMIDFPQPSLKQFCDEIT